MPSPSSPASLNGALVASSLFLDVVMAGLEHPPRLGEEQWVDHAALLPGGSANQAVALARLGTSVRLHCLVGTDAAGTLVRSLLEKEGIDLGTSVEVEHQNLTTSLSWHGDRSMTSMGTTDVPPLRLVEEPPALLLADLPTLAANRGTVRSWRESGCLVLADVGWDRTGLWSPDDLSALDLVDVFTPNEEEARRYTRSRDAKEAALVLARHAPIVILTCGSEGALAAGSGVLERIPALDVKVVDTTGAGDSFSAGLAHALLRGAGLVAAISLAQLTAACTVSKAGGSLHAPRPQDVRALVEDVGLPAGYDRAALDLLD